jgi:hypothetical protein
MLLPMDCPFCGTALVPGELGVRAVRFRSMITVVWETPYRSAGLGAQEVLSPGFFREGVRPARYCRGCGAVVVDPVVDPAAGTPAPADRP